MGEECAGPVGAEAANLTSGRLFRRVHKIGKAWGEKLRKGGLTRSSGVRRQSWDGQVSAARSSQDMCSALPCGRRRTEQIHFLLGQVSIQTTERYLGCKQRRGQRQNRNRTTGRSQPLSVRFADQLPEIFKLAR